MDRYLLLPLNQRHNVGPSHQVPWDESIIAFDELHKCCSV
jgi:hypothetical protein